MAVSANLWHPLAFDARSSEMRRTVARSLFSHTCGALPPPRLLGAIDTVIDRSYSTRLYSTCYISERRSTGIGSDHKVLGRNRPRSHAMIDVGIPVDRLSMIFQLTSITLTTKRWCQCQPPDHAGTAVAGTLPEPRSPDAARIF